jgi:hypothetical protein
LPCSRRARRNSTFTSEAAEYVRGTQRDIVGLSSPTVILAEQEFIGEDGRPFTVAEYKNMAGGAGRLGFNETGKAIILAENLFQRRELFNRYVRGAPELIRSSFTDHDVRTWVIRLLSQVKAVKESDVPRLLSNTYGGFIAREADPKWQAETEARIAAIVAQFLELGLLERHDDQVQLTLLGRACGQSSLAFDSSTRLIEAIRSTSGRELTAFRLVGLIQMLPEADSLYTPVRKKARTEGIRVSQAASRFGDSVVQALRRWVGDEIAFWGRCKRAAILADWMEGVSIQEIERSFSVPFGGQVQSGDITRFADATRFHLRSARQILSALLTMTPEQEVEFDLIGRQTRVMPLAGGRPCVRRAQCEVIRVAPTWFCQTAPPPWLPSVPINLLIVEGQVQGRANRRVGRQCCGFCRKARRDEPGREGTLQHAAEIKLCAGYCNPNWVAAVAQWVTTPACHLRRPGQVPGPLASVGGSGR